MLILGIETSCDETAVAVYDGEKGLLANRVFSQIELHRPHGGVVPELASRDHIERLLPMIEEAISSAVSVRVHTSLTPPVRKRRFGLFGLGRREREEYPVEPRLETPMPSAARQPAVTARAPSGTPAPASPASQRATAESPRQQNPSPDDLFAGVAEDDRFEIPAFLRRQANTGGNGKPASSNAKSTSASRSMTRRYSRSSTR